MTSPPLASTGPGGRHYTLPGPNPKHDYMSVTTIIDRGKPKNLGGWYKKTTAEYAYDHRPRWEGLDRPAAVKLITAQADRIRDTAAARGDEAHQHLEDRLNGRHPDRLLYTPTTLHYIDAVDQFINEWAPRPVLVEATIYNHEHRYAGSLDLIADLPDLGRTLIDAKTSARVYDEAAWQLAAYRHADQHTSDMETLHPMPAVDSCAVLWLRPGCEPCDLMANNTDAAAGTCPKCGLALVGRYKLVEIVADDNAYAAFLAGAHVAGWSTGGWKGAVGQPHRPPRDLAAETKTNLTGRARRLQPAAQQWVADHWPAGTPALKHPGRHHPAQLAAIRQLIEQVETATEAPFDPPPAAPLTPQRLTETLGIAPADLASVETCEALAARARRLPSDLLAAVNTAVVRDGLPNLKSGRVTGDHADQIDAILELADTAHNTRTVRALEAVVHLRDSDLIPAVGVVAGIDPARPHTDWTGDETDTYVAIAEWCAGDGPYTLTYTDDGQAVIGADPDPALDRLVELAGGKRALLAAAKQVNTDRRLRMQVGSSADVAANLTLTALTATRLTEQADQ